MKSEVASFRLDKGVLSSLKKEAQRENLSLNSLVNKILDQHANWHSFAPKIGIVPVGSEVLKKLFKNMDDEQLQKMAKEQASVIHEDLILLKHDDSLEAFLALGTDFLNVCGFPYSIKEKNDTVKLTFRHPLGKKYSVYIEELVRNELELITKKKAEVSSTNNTVSLEVDL